MNYRHYIHLHPPEDYTAACAQHERIGAEILSAAPAPMQGPRGEAALFFAVALRIPAALPISSIEQAWIDAHAAAVARAKSGLVSVGGRPL